MRRLVGAQVLIPEYCFNGTSNADTESVVRCRITDASLHAGNSSSRAPRALLSLRCADDKEIYTLPAWTLFTIEGNADVIRKKSKGCHFEDVHFYEHAARRNRVFADMCKACEVRTALVLDGSSANTAKSIKDFVPTIYQVNTDATTLLLLTMQGHVPVLPALTGRVERGSRGRGIAGVYEMLHRAIMRPSSLTKNALQAYRESDAMALDIYGVWKSPMYDDVLRHLSTRKPRPVKVLLLTYCVRNAVSCEPRISEDYTIVYNDRRGNMRWYVLVHKSVSQKCGSHGGGMLGAAQSITASSRAEEKDVACSVCGDTSSHEGDEMLLCDGCDSGHHLRCVRPALREVPEGDWFCVRCTCPSSLDVPTDLLRPLTSPAPEILRDLAPDFSAWRIRGLRTQCKQASPFSTGVTCLRRTAKKWSCQLRCSCCRIKIRPDLDVIVVQIGKPAATHVECVLKDAPDTLAKMYGKSYFLDFFALSQKQLTYARKQIKASRSTVADYMPQTRVRDRNIETLDCDHGGFSHLTRLECETLAASKGKGIKVFADDEAAMDEVGILGCTWIGWMDKYTYTFPYYEYQYKTWLEDCLNNNAICQCRDTTISCLPPPPPLTRRSSDFCESWESPLNAAECQAGAIELGYNFTLVADRGGISDDKDASALHGPAGCHYDPYCGVVFNTVYSGKSESDYLNCTDIGGLLQKDMVELTSRQMQCMCRYVYTSTPTQGPTTDAPTISPTTTPTTSPTDSPTVTPTLGPTGSPTTESPTETPTDSPITKTPTESPTTKNPTTQTPTVHQCLSGHTWAQQSYIEITTGDCTAHGYEIITDKDQCSEAVNDVLSISNAEARTKTDRFLQFVGAPAPGCSYELKQVKKKPTFVPEEQWSLARGTCTETDPCVCKQPPPDIVEVYTSHQGMFAMWKSVMTPYEESNDVSDLTMSTTVADHEQSWCGYKDAVAKWESTQKAYTALVAELSSAPRAQSIEYIKEPLSNTLFIATNPA
eukprot:gene127-182_t